MPDGKARECFPVDVDVDAAHGKPTFGQIAQCAQPVEHLDSTWLQTERTRCHGRPVGFVEYPYGDPRGPQAAGERQSRRSGSHDRDVCHHAALLVLVTNMLGANGMTGNGW
ncbi:hypothetical protein MMAGJ_56860 [Mycolicibacterium mageritense]|uniref:Uncharacterized protein n=1 Tax=Mycolicibacterium mageritense TaxID=53462 RepID=A0ABM7I0J5_MYCME|nr:hypothetical protein MMAGJ_56860 [Mycolicibacterium mageritense]